MKPHPELTTAKELAAVGKLLDSYFVCPKCGNRIVRRQAETIRKGSKAAVVITASPRCRHTDGTEWDMEYIEGDIDRRQRELAEAR